MLFLQQMYDYRGVNEMSQAKQPRLESSVGNNTTRYSTSSDKYRRALGRVECVWAIPIWLVIIAINATPQSRADEPELVSLPMLAEAYKQNVVLFKQSDSFVVECEWRDTTNVFLSRDDPSSSKSIVARDPGYRFVLGKRGTDWYCSVRNNQSPTAQNHICAFTTKDGVSVNSKGKRGEAAMITKGIQPDCWQWWVYTQCILFNILDDVEGLDISTLPPAIRPIFFPDGYYARPADCEMGDQPELVNGETCYSITMKPSVRLWLSAKHKYAAIRVEEYWTGTKLPSRLPKRTLDMSDLREAKMGLWLPWSIRETLFTDPNHDTKEIWGQAAVTQTLQVTRMEFDTLTDASFEVPIADGTLVIDEVRQLRYHKGASDTEPFKETIEAAKQQRPRTRFWLIATGNAVLIAILCGYLLLRRYRRS
jgi:hypothetical protein